MQSTSVVVIYNLVFLLINFAALNIELVNVDVDVWQSILYFLCVIAFEYFPMNKVDMSSIARWVGNCGVFARSFSDSTLEPLLNPTKDPDFDADEDVDVKTERDRVLSGASKDAIIYLHNLHKVYILSRWCICYLW